MNMRLVILAGVIILGMGVLIAGKQRIKSGARRTSRATAADVDGVEAAPLKERMPGGVRKPGAAPGAWRILKAHQPSPSSTAQRDDMAAKIERTAALEPSTPIALADHRLTRTTSTWATITLADRLEREQADRNNAASASLETLAGAVAQKNAGTPASSALVLPPSPSYPVGNSRNSNERIVAGHVTYPDGRAMGQAEVFLFEESYGFYFNRSSRFSPKLYAQIMTTETDGAFSFRTKSPSFSIVVRHSSGIAMCADVDFQNRSAIVVHPWGRLEGMVTEGEPQKKKPRPNVWVEVRFYSRQVLPPPKKGERTPATVSNTYYAKTDAQGHFVIDGIQVGTGSAWAELEVQNNAVIWDGFYQVPTTILPGKTTTIEIRRGFR